MGTIRVKREPIKIPGRTAELLSRTEAHHHVIDDDRHFLVVAQEQLLSLSTCTTKATVFQEFNNDELGPPFRMVWVEANEGHPPYDWAPEFGCQPVRAEVAIAFVADGGAEV